MVCCRPQEVIYMNNSKIVRQNLCKSDDSATYYTIEYNEVSCLHVPEDNLNFLLVGYRNGAIELLNSATLKPFSDKKFHYKRKDFGSIEKITFHVDNFVNMCVVHEHGVVNNVILGK